MGDAAVAGVPTTPAEDGIEVPWLFTAGDIGGSAPHLRAGPPGAPWLMRQEHAAPARDAARRMILEDLEGGATAVGLRFDRAACTGVAPGDTGFAECAGRDGTAIHCLDDLDEVLDGVLLDGAPVALAAGASALPAAALLVALWRRRSHDLRSVSGSLGIDPLGTLAAFGVVHGTPDEAVSRAAGAAAELDGLLGPDVTVLAVDTAPYVAAGASAVQELAIAAATATRYLAACEEAGLAPEAANARIEFTLQADADQFTTMARFRAMRRVWARILELCGVPEAERRCRLAARTSARMLSTVDPWVNMLRTTTAAFAAAVAGADVITVAAFDEPRGGTSELGRRIARNTHHILMDESHLAHVGDPGAGAWYVEWLTEELARAAWTEMTEIEDGGGIVAALTSGRLAERLGATATRRADEVARRTRVLTGVNAFPLLGDDGVPAADTTVDAAFGRRETDRLTSRPAVETPPDAGFAEMMASVGDGARLDQVCPTATHRQAPLTTRRDGAAFEALREAASSMDPAPRILLACVGPIARHNAITTWARSLFEAGGIEARLSPPILDGAAIEAVLADAPEPLAAVCAAADEDPDLLRSVVAALRARGAIHVYLVRGPEDLADAIGADRAVGEGIDVVGLLGHALTLTAGATA